MIERHVEYTDSTPGKWALDNWKETCQQFVKVMPRDYKAVLEKKKKEMAIKS